MVLEESEEQDMKREQEFINKASYDVWDERERFRHELHDKIGEQEWFGSEEFWVRVRDIEHMAADLHMKYKEEGENI